MSTRFLGSVVLVLMGSVAAGLPMRAASDVERTVRLAGRARTYRVHIPTRVGTTPMPLVLAFHGGGSNAQAMARLVGLDEKADRDHFVVAYPEGSGRLPSVRTWNAGSCCGYATTQGVDDVAFVRALIDDVSRIAHIDSARIYATGISNGGQMAYRLAAEMPDRIAAIAPVAASLEVPLGPNARPVPVVAFHGTNDDHLPMHGGRGRRSVAGVDFRSVDHSIGAWVRVNGCQPTPLVTALPDRVNDGTRVEQHAYQCPNAADVVLYVIHGGGHTWPGRPTLERVLGVTTRDISATNLMWEFFIRHQR